MSTELRHETAPEDRISFPHKLIYGLGAFVNNLLAGAIGGMTIVLNLGLGMNPALVGLLGAGAWQQRSSPLRLSPQEPPLFHRQRVDALPHPVVGVLTDRIGPGRVGLAGRVDARLQPLVAEGVLQLDQLRRFHDLPGQVGGHGHR